ncbi:MAG: Stp1/IreP family PP2C-type Ser/Thr phosphatase [Raoultibacter sp.]|jgi:serine/threonine protein phosphatase PrpC
MAAAVQGTKGSSSRKTQSSSFGSRTDIGLVRKHNEDSLIVSPPLFAVADGMGGHAAGEVASEVAVNTLAEHAPAHADAEALGQAVRAANLEVIRAATDGRGREGMGTTLTAAMLEGERLVVAQAGDSRAYLLHKGKLQQITRDHSLMADMIEAGQITPAEARVHPNRSVITRALGSDPEMLADLYEINVEAGDRLLLCSDGLSSLIEDDEIEDILLRIGDAQRCASSLVNAAITAGGHDNVTVIVADIEGFAEIKEKKSARRVKAWMVMVVLAFVLIIGGSGAAFSYYIDNSAFLIEEEGKVAVYKGIPGTLFGIQASQLDSVTEVKTSDLAPGLANRIKEGIQVESLDEAYDLVEEYEKEANKKAVPSQ